MVLLSITPLPDGVLQLDIIAPFHTSGPPLLQFHLDIEQWGYAGGSRGTFPIAFGQFFSMASVLNNAIEAWERACYNITNTSFQINYGGPILYLAIGKA